MQTIKANGYSVYFNEKSYELLNKFIIDNNYSNIFILVDNNTNEKCLLRFLSFLATDKNIEIIEIEAGESEKNITTCVEIWSILTEFGADRKSLLINVGGGVITDIGGFVASTFKRGIDFINIPTTLLSMVDASVGGKTGVDFEGIKNHIGTTYEPKGVFVNSFFIETLSERLIKNGYAEIIKIALIADSEFWKKLKKLKSYKTFYSENIISKAIELKNTIVKKDLHETNLRKSLNFGHNIGHALESSLIKQKKDILHGEAVAFGILLESEIATQLKRLLKKELKEISDYIHSIYKTIKLSPSTKKMMLEFLLHDKKNQGEKLCFALPKHIGNYELCCDVKIDDIKNVLSNY